MQNNITREIFAMSMPILHGLVLEQVAFHTQIPYNLYYHVAKIILRSDLVHPNPPTIPCVDTF
jgi:hypothetical protein